MKIELYFWEGCPSHPEAKALLEDVLAERGIDEPIELREVFTEEQAVALGFPGSPTIRVDGSDVQPPGPQEPGGLTCRVYRLRDGRLSPLPDPEDIRAALARAGAGKEASD